MENDEKKNNAPTFREAFLFWLKLGFISFGGPAGQIAIMHEYVVEKKKWISESKFLHALNYCMLLPGPEAQQLATYIGWLLHKVKGGLAAGILFVLPSVFILLILSFLYVSFGNIPAVNSIFTFLKSAVVAIVILALIKIAGRALKNYMSYIIAALSFVSIYFLNIPFPFVIIATIIISIAVNSLFPDLSQTKDKEEKILLQEDEYSVNMNSVIEHSRPKPVSIFIKIITFSILWVIPLLSFQFFSNDSLFWKELILFFTKSAFISFGGAYSVLSYVAQEAVEKYYWLTKLQMIDGLALGETTPGPLIMVLSFVGFIAGYNHAGGSILTGAAGLLITTYYTFLPSFFFIIAGAPFIEMTQHNEKLKSILNYVIAAVVGVILNLTIYIAAAVVFPDGVNIGNIDFLSLILIAISLTALYYFKVNMITWLGVSVATGLLYYYFIV